MTSVFASDMTAGFDTLPTPALLTTCSAYAQLSAAAHPQPPIDVRITNGQGQSARSPTHAPQFAMMESVHTRVCLLKIFLFTSTSSAARFVFVVFLS